MRNLGLDFRIGIAFPVFCGYSYALVYPIQLVHGLVF